MTQIIVITGASSGFGALAAHALAKSGHAVYAGMRDAAGRNAPQMEALQAHAAQTGVDLPGWRRGRQRRRGSRSCGTAPPARPRRSAPPTASSGPVHSRRSSMPFANIKVPQAALSKAQKEEIVHRVTNMFVEYFSEAARPHTMILIEEVPDGGYGRADEVFVIPGAYRAKD